MLAPSKFQTALSTLDQLPRWALVAIAARSALREPQLITGWSAYYSRPTDHRVLFQRLVIFDAVESAASSARRVTQQTLKDSRNKWLELSQKSCAPRPLGFSSPSIVISPEGAAGAALAAATIEDIREAKKAAITSIQISVSVSRIGATQQNILKDIEIITRAAASEGWTDESPVPPHAFAVFSNLDNESSMRNDTKLEVLGPMTEKLVEFFARHPKYLATTDPKGRVFENLYAEIFKGFRFTVELTAKSGDGGIDVIAVRNDASPSKYLIQCKRKGTEKIDVGVVRELHGVVHDTLNQGSKGLIATTSWLTEPARKLVERNPLWLEAADYNQLVKWLTLYERSRFESLPIETIFD